MENTEYTLNNFFEKISELYKPPLKDEYKIVVDDDFFELLKEKSIQNNISTNDFFYYTEFLYNAVPVQKRYLFGDKMHVYKNNKLFLRVDKYGFIFIFSKNLNY